MQNLEFFICYSKFDAVKEASEINLVLKNIGLNSFCDVHDDPKLELQEKIYEKIKLAEKVIFILSIQSLNSLKNEDSWISKELKLANNLSKPIYTINLVPESNLTHLENKFINLKHFAFIYNDLTPQEYLVLLKPLTIKQSVLHTRMQSFQEHHIAKDELFRIIEEVILAMPYYKEYKAEITKQLIQKEFPTENIHIPISALYSIINKNDCKIGVLPLINSLISIIVFKSTRNSEFNSAIFPNSKIILVLITKLIKEILICVNPFSESSQGFIVLPIFSRIVDGEIKELIRFHFWSNLLDKNSNNDDFAVHSHQSYARSWILYGNIFNTVYKIEPNKTTNDYSIFEPYWDNLKKYDLKHSVSTIKNTRQNVSVYKKYSMLLTQNDSYEIPSGEYHKSELFSKNDCLPISLFCFDSSNGWFKDAGIIGPSSVDLSTFDKKKNLIDSTYLIEMLESIIKNMLANE